MAFLELRSVSKYFGGLSAINRLDMEVQQGEILGLIGPNGAGKTTTFNVISGEYPPTNGQIFFNGKAISGLRPHLVAKLGIVRSFQLNTLFTHLTVIQNVLLGLHLHSKINFLEGLFNTRSNRTKEQELNEKVLEILEFMDLSTYAYDEALNLPHGHQRALGIAIALASQPKVLLLDEPLTGMTSSEVEVMLEIIRKIRDTYNITVVVVEHNMKAVMALCERLVVISFGQKIAEGDPEAIQSNPQVIEAYLGRDENAA